MCVCVCVWCARCVWDLTLSNLIKHAQSQSHILQSHATRVANHWMSLNHSVWHTYLLAYIQTHIRACIHANIHMYIHVFLHTYSHIYIQTYKNTCKYSFMHMGWPRLVGSIKLQFSFAEYSLFYRSLVQKRPIIVSIPLTEATSYMHSFMHTYIHTCPHAYISINNLTYIHA